MTYPRPRALRVAALLAALLAGSSAAWAHAILVESRPAIGTTIPAGPVALWLRYNSRIDAARSRLTLTLPDRSQRVLPITPEGEGDILTSNAELAAGAYSLRWQVLAIDGHITRGDVPFTVKSP
jgi:methionine-rich copper-binding protein CopC